MNLSKVWLLLISLLLVGCDGGIFGTGDGDGTIIDPDLSADTPPVETPEISTDPIDGAEPGNPTDPAEPLDPAAPTTETPTISAPTPAPEPDASTSYDFNNTEVATERDDALLRVIHADANLQDNIVVTLNNQRDNPLLPLPGLSFIDAADQYRSIDPATNHTIRIYSSEDFRNDNDTNALTIFPFSVAEGTITTVILRSSEVQSAQDRVLTLETKSSLDDDQSGIRVTHAASGISEIESIDVYITQPAADLSTLQPVASALSFQDNPSSDYTMLYAGTYQLQMTQSGESTVLYTDPNLITLEGSQLLNLVIRDDPTESQALNIEVLQISDSELPAE